MSQYDINYNKKSQPKTFRLPPKIWRWYEKQAKEYDETLAEYIQDFLKLCYKEGNLFHG